MSFELRPYQVEAVAASRAAHADRDVHRQAIGLPTGTGKTIVFSHIIAERGYPALILAHRDELIQQAIDKYQQVDPTVPIGIVKGKLNQADLPVVAASVQTISRMARLAKLPTDWKTIVIDEAHHAAADSYRRVTDHYSNVDLLLGVSATLERADRKALGKTFDEVVYSRGILEMILEGYLVDIRGLAVKVKGFNLDDAKVVRGDFQDGQIGEMLEDAHADEVAVAAYEEHAAGRKTIVFTPTIASAESFARAFQAAGHAAVAVSGELSLDERRERIEGFRDGEYRIVTNAMLLTEGFDEPAVDCIMVARPTKSKGLYIQMCGRGTRLFPGKEDLLVIDLVGNEKRMDLISIPRLLQLDPRKVEREGVIAAKQYRDQLPEIQARQRAGLADIELVSTDARLFDRKDINWIALQDGSWLLDGKRGTLVLEPSGGKWRSVLYPKEETRPPLLVCDGVDLTWAMGVAEEKIVRRAKAETLKVIDRTAPWRLAAPGDKQLNLLRKNGIPIKEGLTKGEASDLITAVTARKQIRRNRLQPVPLP